MVEKKGILGELAKFLEKYEDLQETVKQDFAVDLNKSLTAIEQRLLKIEGRLEGIERELAARQIEGADAGNAPVLAVEEEMSEEVYDDEETAEEVRGEDYESENGVSDEYGMEEEEGEYDEDEQEQEDAMGEEPDGDEEVQGEDYESENGVSDEYEMEEGADEYDEDEQEDVEEEDEDDFYDWQYDYPADPIEDLTGSMGINDKMMYIRELFDGDEFIFDATMRKIDTFSHFKEIINYLITQFPGWDYHSSLVYQFLMHIRRKFRV